jgi:hypothetical protein
MMVMKPKPAGDYWAVALPDMAQVARGTGHGTRV